MNAHRNHASRTALAWAAGLALGAAAGCGGGISYQYDTGSVHAIHGASSLRARATQAIDARDGGSGRRADDELRDVRRSVDEHLVRAGVVDAPLSIVPAPSDPAAVDRILADAAQSGTPAVLFVRYHGAVPIGACGSTAIIGFYFGLLPWLILDSIPFWHHGAYSVFEVVAVDPASHDVLAREMRAASFSEHVSSWGCGADGVMHDMERRALEGALEAVVAQGTQGWPRRVADPNLASTIVLGPTVRRSGEHVIGPGYTFDAPADWQTQPHDPQQPMRAISVTSPDGFALSVIMSPSDVNDHDFANDYTNVFRGHPGFANERTVGVGDIEARQFEVPVATNMTVQRATAAGGMAIVLMCVGPAPVLAAHRADCDRAMQSLVTTGELISDGHR